MAYALIWVESLAVALLLVALVTAWTAHSPRRLVQAGPPVLVALVLIGAAALLTFGIGFLYTRGTLDGYRLGYALSWTVALTVGSAVVLFRGLSRPEEGASAARAWPRARLGLGLAALLVVACITFTNVDLAIKVELASVRAEAGARAMALTPPRVPDRDNAALVYQQAFDVLTPRDKLPPQQRDAWFPRQGDNGRRREDLWRAVLSGPKLDSGSEELKKFLASQRRGLALLRQAAAMPSCWFGHDYHDGFNLRLPELLRLRDGASLLILSALAKAGEGDSRGAVADLALVFRMAKHLNDPTLITFVAARAIERDGTRALEAILARATPRAEDLAPLAAAGETHSREELVCVLRMEEAAASAFFATLSDPSSTRWLVKDADSPGIWLLKGSFYRVFFLPGDLAAYHRTIRRFQELAERPYYQAQKELDAFERAFKRHQGGILTRLIMPAADKCILAAVHADSLRELRRLAVAVTAYREKNGEFPQRLDDLVPAHLAQAPLDPYDGQPLRLKRDGRDLILYSIGPDLRDDGGTPWDPVRKEGDLVFRLRGR
jgi:hypothetical protein